MLGAISNTKCGALKIETDQGKELQRSRAGFEEKIKVTQWSITVGEQL